MAKQKKEPKPKYQENSQVEESVKSILKNCANVFSGLAYEDFKILLKAGKNKLGKKHVVAKILKEPVTLLTNKKILLLITDEFWDESIDSDRTKALIEGLMSIVRDDNGDYEKRDYDYMTFSELLNNAELDFSKFVKVLPGEKNNSKENIPDFKLS